MAAEQMAWQRDWAVAPGEILLEAIQDRGMSQSDLARRMGRPIKTINEIVNGKAAITPDTAIQLEMTLGIEAAFWDNLESAYRAHLARERVEADLADHVSWAATFPLKDLVKHKLITRGDKKPATVRELFAFFGVGTREAWNSHWGAPAVEYRASPAFEASPLATAAWLRWGELIAGRIETEPFDAKRFRAVLAEIRNMTRRDFPLIHGKVQALCSSAGVALVLTPEFAGTHLSGAARWLAPDKAILQLSLRHKTDDHFWFTFFHEARHLLARKRVDHVDGVAQYVKVGEDEDEADRFSRDMLIPPNAYEGFLSDGTFTDASIKAFAKEQNIAPGIVVGRLQREDRVPPSHFNNLKKPVNISAPS